MTEGQETLLTEQNKFRAWSGTELMSAKFKKRDWLVENILRERDTMLFVGDEKAGKSLVIQQLVCCLTSQHAFFDKYKVSKPCRISYIQLEGEIEDTQDRFKRLSSTIDFNPEMFQLLFYPPISFGNTDEYIKLGNDIISHHRPDIVVIDPLYCAMEGSLNDDVAVRQFLGAVRIFKNTLNCGIIIVHHTHKMRLDRDGKHISEGDEATFGSKFLKAYPDHTMLLAYNKKTEERIMSCSTQRAGDIEKNLVLKLQQDPLYFYETEEIITKEDALHALLKAHPEGLTSDKIMEIAELPSRTFYRSLKVLYNQKRVLKSKTRPVVYNAV